MPSTCAPSSRSACAVSIALPAVEIRPNSGIYDYTARYTAGETRFIVPAALGEEVSRECAELAKAAHRVLGLRDVARIDFRLGEDGRIYFLEVNALPSLDSHAALFGQGCLRCDSIL